MGCDGAGAHLSWSWTPCPAGTPHLIRSPRRTSASDSPTAAPQSKLWETRERERWAEIHGLKSVVLLWELAPRYDENPVVHHRTRDHEEPVVVHVSRRIHDLNLLWSGTQHNRVKEHQTVPIFQIRFKDGVWQSKHRWTHSSFFSFSFSFSFSLSFSFSFSLSFSFSSASFFFFSFFSFFLE